MKRLFTPKVLSILLLSYIGGKNIEYLKPDPIFASSNSTTPSSSHPLPACRPGEDRLAYLIDEYNQKQPPTTSQNPQNPLQTTTTTLPQPHIIGEATAQDLTNIVNAATEYHRTTNFTLSDLNITQIVIFPAHKKQEVDYIGLSYPTTGQLRLFSNNIFTEGVIYHEFSHFHLESLKQKNPWMYYMFTTAWNFTNGPYNDVITKQKRDVIDVLSYNDGRTGAHLGYITHYGGKSLDEDIATYIAAIKTTPETFSTITDTFDIYKQKLDLLKSNGFISDEEKNTALHHLTAAQTKHNQPPAPKIDYCSLPNTPSETHIPMVF